jgi:hypothetical protein
MAQVTVTVVVGNGPDAYVLRGWLNNVDRLCGNAAVHPSPSTIGQTGSDGV